VLGDFHDRIRITERISNPGMENGGGCGIPIAGFFVGGVFERLFLSLIQIDQLPMLWTAIGACAVIPLALTWKWLKPDFIKKLANCSVSAIEGILWACAVMSASMLIFFMVGSGVRLWAGPFIPINIVIIPIYYCRYLAENFESWTLSDEIRSAFPGLARRGLVTDRSGALIGWFFGLQ